MFLCEAEDLNIKLRKILNDGNVPQIVDLGLLKLNVK
jgi:hypothetical protein